MENGPFIDDFPIKTSIYEGFSMAMLNNQRVYMSIIIAIIQLLDPVRLDPMRLRLGSVSAHDSAVLE
jgi:hypothetical protein